MIRVYRSLDEVQLADPGPRAAVAFGSFDGLHRAHRALIERVREQASRFDGLSAVLSFSNHPLSVLAPPYCPKLLMSPDRKIEILRQWGVDVAILPPFTRELSQISANRFIREILLGRLGMRHIVCGYDCRFGRGAQGNGELLEKEGARLGFSVEVFEPLTDGGVVIGSHTIRELLFLGDVQRAAELLGRPHELTGLVVPGDQRGRRLGFPTANLQFPDECVLPATGAYAVWVDFAGRRYGGMMNIGSRPTFGQVTVVPEVHLFSFEGDLLGQSLTVYFLRRLRAEKRFASPEALIRQLEADRQAAQKALLEYGSGGRSLCPIYPYCPQRP